MKCQVFDMQLRDVTHVLDMYMAFPLGSQHSLVYCELCTVSQEA